MYSSLLCYADPIGYLASRGYGITCTKQRLILPVGDQQVEFDTPFARVILTKALRYVEPGLGPGLVEPGTMPAAVSRYIKEIGKTGIEAEYAAVDLFCSDDICDSDGGPHGDMFIVKCPNAKIYDYVSYTDEGALRIDGFKQSEPYYKVFEICDITQAVPVGTLTRYLSNNRIFYLVDSDNLYVSNTRAAKYGCPPSLEHMGLEIVRKKDVLPRPVCPKIADVEWQDALHHFETDPCQATAQLMVQSYCLRKNFLDIRKEFGPIDPKELFDFRSNFLSAENGVSYPEFRDVFVGVSGDALYRFRLYMELRGLLNLTPGVCYYE